MPHREVGCIVGVFDLFHIGHLDRLLRAAEHCDELVVALPGDDLVESWTGERPFVPQTERAEILAAVRCVGRVELLDTPDLTWVVARVGADRVLVGAGAQDLLDRLVVPADLQLIRLGPGRTTRSAAVTAALGRRHRPLVAGRSQVA